MTNTITIDTAAVFGIECAEQIANAWKLWNSHADDAEWVERLRGFDRAANDFDFIGESDETTHADDVAIKAAQEAFADKLVELYDELSK